MIRVSNLWTIRGLDKRGRLIWEEKVHNLVTNQGMNLLLNVGLGSTAKPTYYCGLKGSGAYALTDTMSAKSWTELTTYSAGARPTWTPGTAASQQISNSASIITFTFTGTTTVYGGFLSDNSIKGGTGGNLFSVTEYPTTKVFNNGESMQVLIAYAMADDGV